MSREIKTQREYRQAGRQRDKQTRQAILIFVEMKNKTQGKPSDSSAVFEIVL